MSGDSLQTCIFKLLTPVPSTIPPFQSKIKTHTWTRPTLQRVRIRLLSARPQSQGRHDPTVPGHACQTAAREKKTVLAALQDQRVGRLTLRLARMISVQLWNPKSVSENVSGDRERGMHYRPNVPVAHNDGQHTTIFRLDQDTAFCLSRWPYEDYRSNPEASHESHTTKRSSKQPARVVQR